jgi:glycosyltransferase involved in cell wall biosynthesis
VAEFSILLPSYNYGNFVAEAIESVLAQTWSDFELIIIDDASTDDSWSIIERFQDPRVTAVRAVENRGLVATLNAAMELSTGDIVGVLNADDRYPARALQTYHDAFAAHPDADVIGSYVRTIDAAGKQSPRMQTEHFYNTERDLSDPAQWVFQNPLAGGALIRRAALDAVGGFGEDCAPIVDWNLWARCLAAGTAMSVLPEVLYEWRMHRNNITGSDPAWTLRCYASMCKRTFHPYLRSIGREDLIQRNLEIFLTHDEMADQDDAFRAEVLADLVTGQDQSAYVAALGAIAREIKQLRADSVALSGAQADRRWWRDVAADLEGELAERDREVRAAWDRLGAAEDERRRVEATLAKIRKNPAYRAARKARNSVRRS